MGFTAGAHYYLATSFAIGLRISGREYDQTR